MAVHLSDPNKAENLCVEVVFGVVDLLCYVFVHVLCPHRVLQDPGVVVYVLTCIPCASFC